MSFADLGAVFAATAGFEVFAALVVEPVGLPEAFLSVFGPFAIVYGVSGCRAGEEGELSGYCHLRPNVFDSTFLGRTRMLSNKGKVASMSVIIEIG
jgi:hypothetical protein